MKITINNDVFQVFSLIEGKLGKNNLFFVGGFVRDTLLGRITDDLDFATPLDPQVVFSMFPYAHFFQKFGTVSFKINQFHITIASFRKESDYKDFRHPDDVVFVKSLKEDSKRRDFTINCLYVNSSLEVLDPTKRGLV
ncbi:MAG: hypothetical protein WCR67_07245, partial [Bacilli bacterium]